VFYVLVIWTRLPQEKNFYFNINLKIILCMFAFFCRQAFTDHGCKQINLDMGSINVKEGQRRVMNTSLKYPEYVYVMHFELLLVK
jgi:hypothetical protein